MEKVRKFEVAKGFEDKGINLPVRKTKYSAGYDIEAAEDVIVPSFKKGMNPTLVKTGIKAYMQDDEVLILANRSSNPKKKGLILAKVAEMKGIEKDEVMVLGDSFNDYSMFTEFKNSYAMKNAIDDIKKIATYVTETNNNDGVGKAIEKVLNMQ